MSDAEEAPEKEGSRPPTQQSERESKQKKDHQEKDVLEWKRNVAIEQRELAYLDAQEAKQQERVARWELERLERENLTAAARERKKRAFHKAVALKKESDAKSDYREKMREINLNQKEGKWQKKEGDVAKKICEKARFEERETERILSEVRDKKLSMGALAAEKRDQANKEQATLDAKRGKKIYEKERRHYEKDLLRVRRVQNEFQEELVNNIPNAEIPMKSTLVHAVSAPSVSELNFALRELRENLDDLRHCDMERRAKSQGIRVFQLVKRMEEEAVEEWQRIHKSVGIN